MADYTVPRELRQAYSPVFRHEIDGRTVWVKQARRSENPLGWWAQRLLHGATGLLLLLPPEKMTHNRVRFEAETLMRLAELGVPVPPVLHVEADYFVMADCGPDLVQFLKANRNDAATWITRAAEALRALHDLGQVHGGAQIKNFTVLDGRIHFIDFEESIPADRRDEFQLRDLFLFLLSLERHGYDPDPPALCRAYAGDGWRRTWDDLRRELNRIRVVRLSEWRVFDRIRMRDIRSLSRLVAKSAAGAIGTE